MDPVSTTPAHVLMQHKEREDRHGPGAVQGGASSAFASYAFGPLQLPDGKEGGRRDTRAEGAPTGKNPLEAPSMSWITTIQGVDNGKPGGGTSLG